MGCRCSGAKRSARLTKVATRKATRAAKAGVKIKKASPKKASAKKTPAKKAKPCNCD